MANTTPEKILQKIIIPYLKRVKLLLKNFFSTNFSRLKKELENFPYERVRSSYKYCLVLNSVLLIFIVYESLFAKHRWQGDIEKRFEIRKGMHLDNVIYELKEEDIIDSPLIFKLVIKLSGNEESLMPRSYLLRNGISNLTLLKLFTDQFAFETFTFTAPPGYSIRQLSRLVERKMFLSGEKFISESKNDSLLALINMKDKVSDLEGFLFPETYQIASYMTEKDIIELMFNQFLKKVYNSGLHEQIKKNNKSLLEVITLASIIESETQLDKEKPTIAGVYMNRLQKRMKLEADPTVQYALPDGPKQRLLYEDLKIDSPYNTYRNFGLPPGPINNPGLEAIKAAISPEQNEYLFFVATGDGGHKFSRSYEEHLDAVKEYRSRMKQKEQKPDSTIKK